MKTNDEDRGGDPLDANLAKLIHKDNLPPAPSAGQKEVMFEALRAKQAETKSAARPAPLAFQPLFWGGIAAAIALVGLFALAKFPPSDPIAAKPAPEVKVPLAPGHAPPAPEPAPPEPEADFVPMNYFAERGAERFELRDGTVAIAERGTLFTETALRRLKLDLGSIYLVVAKDEEPLEVITPDGKALALGTRFLITSDGDESRVAVAQGSVRLVGPGEDIELARGQEGVLADGGLVRRPAPRLSHLLGWAREHLGVRKDAAADAAEVRNGLIAVDPNGQEARLSLREYTLDVFIEDGVARTTIDQTFFNHYHANTEGTFYFPLPPGAAVSRMAMYVFGKRNEAGMVERSRGQQIYNDIKYANRDPALLEQLEGNLYKLRIFPLEPRQEKRIFISFTQPVDELYRTLRYWFPMDHTQANAGKLKIKVRVKGGAELYEAKSSTHHFDVKEEGDDLLLAYEAENTKPDQDLLLQLLPKEPAKRLADSSKLSRDGSHFLQARVRPLLAGEIEPKPRQWFVLYDTSASRSAADLEAQAHILERLMAEGDDADTVAVATLNIDVGRITKAPVPLRGKTARAVVAAVRGAPKIGGTNLEAGIEAMREWIAESGAENPHIVYLGDGLATDGKKTAGELAASLDREVPFIGIAVGKKADLNFLRAAADASGGAAFLMNPDEDLNWRVFDMLASFNTPRLTGVQFEFGGGDEGVTAYADRTTVAAGEALDIVAMSKTELPDKLTVRGELGGKPWEREIDLAGAREEAGYIPRFWAQRHIEELLKDGEEHREEIVRLSKQHYVATPFTSLIVLENDQMYAQYKVEKGRKDHWASYPAPDQIPVVHEPVPWHHPGWGWNLAPNGDAGKVTLAPKTAEEILGNLLPTPHRWPGHIPIHRPGIWYGDFDDYGLMRWSIEDLDTNGLAFPQITPGVTNFSIRGGIAPPVHYLGIDPEGLVDPFGQPPGVWRVDSGLQTFPNEWWATSSGVVQPQVGASALHANYGIAGGGFGTGLPGPSITTPLGATSLSTGRANLAFGLALPNTSELHGWGIPVDNGRYFLDLSQYELGYRIMNHYPGITANFLPLIPALGTTAADRASAVEMKLGREKRGSITDEAAALVRAAEAKRKPVRIDGTITAPDGRMKGESTSPMYLKTEAISDGATWYHIHRELGLATRRHVTPSNLAAIQAGVPHWPPSLNSLEARWDVTLGEMDDESFELVLADPDPDRAGSRIVLRISNDGRLLASRQIEDDELTASLSFRYEGDTVTIVSHAGIEESYEAVEVEVADALFAADLDGLVVLDLPLQKPAFYQQQLAALGEAVPPEVKKQLLRHLITARLRDTRPTAVQHVGNAHSEWNQLIQLGGGSTPAFDHATLAFAVNQDLNAAPPAGSGFLRHFGEFRKILYNLGINVARERLEQFIAAWPESPLLLPLAARCPDPKVWIKLLELPPHRVRAMQVIAAMPAAKSWPERAAVGAEMVEFISARVGDGKPLLLSAEVADFLTDSGEGREHWAKVVAAYREFARDLEPLDRRALIPVLELALDEGDAKLEARCLDRLLDEIAEAGVPEELASLAERYRAHGRDDVAADLFRDALAKIEDPSVVQLQAAAASVRASDEKQSIRWSLRALRKLGETGALADKASLAGQYTELLTRALACDDLKLAQGIALAAYEQLPAHHGLITAVAGHYHDDGDATERWRWISTILDQHPKNAEASGAIGAFYEKRGMMADADAMYADAHSFDSAHPQWLTKRSSALYRAGEFEQADALFRELVGTKWAHQLQRQVPGEFRILAADPGEQVKVTGEAAAEGWEQIGFDDSAWDGRSGRFGPGDSGDALWEAPFHLRQRFDLPRAPRRIDLQAGLHAAACEIYINGVFAQRLEENSGNANSADHPYRVTLHGKALEALREGENVIAVRCEKLGPNPRAYVELVQVFGRPN